MKKGIITILAALFVTAASFAQAANDGFTVPLDKDLTFAIKENAAPQVAVAGPAILQGIWIETTGQSDFLIRDISSGEKSGFELDQVHFLSNANWWFWGDINDTFQLDAEISVWDFDMTLFQADSFAANVPLVTWADGLQGLASFFFSPIFNGNGSAVGSMNKLGLNIVTPYFETLLGYGTLKANGMSSFKGIYNVLDAYLDVGKGFTEIRLGKKLKSAGDFKFNAVAALSQMRGTYGMYDFFTVKYKDSFEGAITFGSKTSSENLFEYFDDYTSALSAYLAYSPFDGFKIEGHLIDTFGSSLSGDADNLAFAGRLSYSGNAGGELNASLSLSYAGSDVDSVWGSDGQDYDDINADSLTARLNADYAPLDFLKISLDEKAAFNNTAAFSDGLITFRTQPILDFDFNSVLNKDICLSAYGVFNVDRLASETSSGQEIVPYMNEAGLELTMADIGVKKLVMDYAVSFSYDDSTKWTDGNSYSFDKVYNSFMVNTQITDTLNFHAAALVRINSEDDAAFVPMGFAFGAKVDKLPLPGNPSLWTHFCYGMNPYESDNYSLYRADDPQNNPAHRTYLLNTLEGSTTKSQISVGLIWSL